MLKTKRLLLRQWTQDDLIPFAKICADIDVMEYYPRPLTSEESDSFALRIHSLIQDRGWGFWAIETLDTHQFIGFVGLHIPKENFPFSPCIEIGWRLDKDYWGHGYATEAANESLRYAFEELALSEVVSFTSAVNLRSQSVMKKIGMVNTGMDFLHPNIKEDDWLCRHVLYKIKKEEWLGLFYK